MKQKFERRLELEPHMPNWRNFSPEKEIVKYLLSRKNFYSDSDAFDSRASLFSRLDSATNFKDTCDRFDFVKRIFDTTSVENQGESHL